MASLELPEVCGAMLLPDCVVFPHGGLPLRIFEPRYREMLSEALESHCFFAIARLLGEETPDPADCTPAMGTIGLIRASREMDDGTSTLLLHGVIRVRFMTWLQDRSYPRVRIVPVPSVFEPASQASAAVESLREAAELALEEFPNEIRDAFRAMSATIDDPVILCDVLSHQFIQDPEERQTLLEIESVPARVAWICRRLNQG
ncbi:MAG: LON peptidase substrate-binding domain-containing protein [Akkermansiaceae bacterium]|jgi:Lon protease-like protein|nr:LON peptidase substrate-binding domain-containing protein [Akkermansiaceae bacterium]